MRTLLPALAALALCACKRDVQPASPGVKDVAVTDHGYEPARLEVKAGEPITLRFTRKTTSTCGDTVLIEGDPVAHLLPKDVPVEVKLQPLKSGALAFECGMHMLHGTIVAR